MDDIFERQLLSKVLTPPASLAIEFYSDRRNHEEIPKSRQGLHQRILRESSDDDL
jgi:hypothetical protein